MCKTSDMHRRLRENSKNPTHGSGWMVQICLQVMVTEFPESHQRKLVDCSDPASETKRPSEYISEFRFIWLPTLATY